MAAFIPGFRSQGIREPLTNRIAGILDEYPDGTQIARELLQNSDDAKSTVQWYLLDHRHHHHQGQTDGPKLFHQDLREYMGPALLAGSDSLFEDKDFKSMKNLAASEKKTDESKIGQMGIGFNSIYHMTDCPSFISGDQFMVIEPHERIFNGENSPFTEGAVRGSFVQNNVGLTLFPDQLRPFSVLEDIDFTKPYQGTIFRFPLRTRDQAMTSDLSKNTYPAEKVLEMLLRLKDEALRGILFLKHIERIEIYELREGQSQPSKIFQIEIVNKDEVRRERQRLLANLKAHVYPDPSSSRDAILEFSVSPIFQLTQEDGTVTQETWHITTMVGNVLTAHDYMTEETDGDLSKHKLIPWVGIGAPAEPGTKIDISRLFCFLPIGIQIPFPVHVNGHFAVKQSRREIWTNQDNDFARHAAAYIKSVWNIHLFKSHIPVAYAKFLDTLGLARGPTYDLWPVSCGEGLGLDAIWQNLLTDTLRVVCENNLRVFFCRSEGSSDNCVVDYKSSWIAGRDIDHYPLLLDALQDLFNVVISVPDPILKVLPGVVESLGLESRILTPALVRDLLREHKSQWSSNVSSDTKVEMLKYCIEDDEIADLEGLPLLPLAGNHWVEFDVDESRERYLVSQKVFKVLAHSNDGVVDLDIDTPLIVRFKDDNAFEIFWSSMEASVIASRVKEVYRRLCYKTKENAPQPTEAIAQPSGAFPTDAWIKHFWEMVRSFAQADRKTLLTLLEGVHVIPITQKRLAPLSQDHPVVYLNHAEHNKEATLVDFLGLLEGQLGSRVLRTDAFITESIAEGYIFDVSKVVQVLHILTKVERRKFFDLDQSLCEVVCRFMAKWLPVDQVLDDTNLHTLRSLPIYRSYEDSTLVSLESPEIEMAAPKWRVAWRFTSADNPWLPKSFKLLADGQPMGQHITKTIKIEAIKESEYWFSVISDLVQYPEDSWDSMVEKFCTVYHVHSKEYDYASVMGDVPFVRAAGPKQSEQGEAGCGPRMSPRLVVDPSLSEYFMSHEEVFPVGVYSKSPVFEVLAGMGMRSKFDANFILERVHTLASTQTISSGNRPDGDHKSALLKLYSQMNAVFKQELSSQEMQEALRSKPWVLATSDSDTNERLYTTQESRLKSDQILVGNQMSMSTFGFNNKDLISCMGWDQPPPLDKVLAHFLTMVDRLKTTTVDDEDGYAFYTIYKYLLEKVHKQSNVSFMRKSLAKKPWILISGSLHQVDRVALKITFDLAPHFVQLPLTDPTLKKLFLAMGVRKTVGQEDLQGLISAVAARYGQDKKMSTEDSDFVVKILEGMTRSDANFEYAPELLIPTTEGLLCKIPEVVFDDVGAQTDISGIWSTDASSNDDESTLSYKFTHTKISPSLAQRLGISMLSTRYWDGNRDLSFEPWSQEEDIMGRIFHILTDYHPSSIFTEFLQNAADAGATKCCFMLDQRSYPDTKVFSPEMAAWQGPALVIYNDAEFTEDDFDALCKLGVGNKRDNTDKIGRHGLGFNSVYHYTDIPSVVSGRYIGFFDPRRQYLPKRRVARRLVAQGGQRCEFLKLNSEILGDQLAPYKDIFGCDMKSHFKGTIFRIPLRTLDTQKRCPQDNSIGLVWNLEKIQGMLQKWVQDAEVGMLFLDNLKTIEIKDNIRGKVSFQWSASKGIKSELRLSDALDNGSTQQSQSRPTLTRIFSINVTSLPQNSESSQWLVHTEHDFPRDIPQKTKEIAEGNGWGASRGIAIPLDFNFKDQSFSGRRFAYLPTTIHTGLPFHIHGVFALTSNRKDLAGGKDREDPNWIWNQYLMEHALPRTAINGFEKLLTWMFRDESQGGPKVREMGLITEQYFKFWPHKAVKDANNSQSGVGVFIKRFFRQSYMQLVFPCRRPEGSPPYGGYRGKDVVFAGFILRQAPGSINQTVRRQLRSIGTNVCDCADRVQVQLQTEWKGDGRGESLLPFRQINEDSIRGLISQKRHFIRDLFKPVEEKRWVMEYVMKALLDSKELSEVEVPLAGLALIPLMNNDWVEPQPKITYDLTRYYTADAATRELINGANILVDESLFSTDILKNILAHLVKEKAYCIVPIPPNVIASKICAKYPNGIQPEIRDKIWNLLKNHGDLKPFEDVPVLKTLSGGLRPLKDAFQGGLEISAIQDMSHKRSVCELASLFKDIGVVVLDGMHNVMHPYLYKHTTKAEKLAVLSAIAYRYGTTSWPDDRELSSTEAAALRNMISLSGDEINGLCNVLGYLRIWETWAGEETPLIAARGSFFVDANKGFDWSVLGSNSNLIRHTDSKHFMAMGARPLDVPDAFVKCCARYRNGIPDELRDSIWTWLRNHDDLKPFGDVPVLRTMDGSLKPLKSGFQGMEISSVQDPYFGRMLRELASLLGCFGITVFEAAQNNWHPYLYTKVPRAERHTVLSAISRSCGSTLPGNRVITRSEAAILRDTINKCGDEITAYASNLGYLKIWESWAPQSSTGQETPLISARGSYFVEATLAFNWAELDHNSNLIRQTDCKHFAAMGAKPLDVAESVTRTYAKNSTQPGMRDKVLRLLRDYTDLKSFGEVAVLKTLDGGMKPLRVVSQAMEISSVPDMGVRQNVIGLASLLKDLGIIVFDATQNGSHVYLYSKAPKAERFTVLSAIANSIRNLVPTVRVLTRPESMILRDMISKSSDEFAGIANKFGHLQIWESWARVISGQETQLISASGSYYIEGSLDFNWDDLGSNPDFIRHADKRHFMALGATPLSIVRATEARVLPRFQNGSLSCTGATRTAYIQIFSQIVQLASMPGNASAPAALDLLQNKKIVLARDGSLQSSKALFDSHDTLCTLIFADMQSKLAHPTVWEVINYNNRKSLFAFRSTTDPVVVRECASHVLSMTQGDTQLSASAVRVNATAMVRFIYRQSSQIDWMDPMWKIVPCEVTKKDPFKDSAPDVPTYMSFKELVDPDWHDIAWTQCAFFPEDLRPSETFKGRFTTVGHPSIEAVAKHLKVLVTDLAPKWITMEQELAFRGAVFKVYKFMEDQVRHNGSAVVRLVQKSISKPYILIGSIPSDPASWTLPYRLMLNTDNEMEFFIKVPRELIPFSKFLAIVGAQTMQAVEGSVDVPNGRSNGEIEALMVNSFETQDERMGFMDIKFKFENGRQLLAHKFFLAHTSSFYKRRLTGIWAEQTRDASDAGAMEIDQKEDYAVFYGLLYYFYTNRLIASNGPLDLDSGFGSDGDDVNELRDRVQYLMDLLHLTYQYEDDINHRLLKLIAREIIDHRKVNHDNVFRVREYAAQIDFKDIQGYCEEYLKKNASSLRTHLYEELKMHQTSQNQLSGEGDGAKRAEAKSDMDEVVNNLLVLERLI